MRHLWTDVPATIPGAVVVSLCQCGMARLGQPANTQSAAIKGYMRDGVVQNGPGDCPRKPMPKKRGERVKWRMGRMGERRGGT